MRDHIESPKVMSFEDLVVARANKAEKEAATESKKKEVSHHKRQYREARGRYITAEGNTDWRNAQGSVSHGKIHGDHPSRGPSTQARAGDGHESPTPHFGALMV